ncbi:hypothetical protein Dimus_014279 [Dionaea muscipula]
MLENQIPLFVLNKLLSLQPSIDNWRKQEVHVDELALGFFRPLMPTGPSGYFLSADEGGLHCLDIFRKLLLKRFQLPVQPDRAQFSIDFRERATRYVSIKTGQKHPTIRMEDEILQLLFYMIDERRQQLIPCVTDLKNAGVKFRKSETGRFWDIKFEKRNGVLEIPRILVHDGTKSLFFNLIAFEQCHMDSTDHVITSYAIFMDNLINSAEDVSHLHSCGIIEHWLGNDAEVANLFNGLCREVVFDHDDSSLSQLSKNINDYYKKRWHAWKAYFINKYFHNPWTAISLGVAIILLLLTFAQTFYTVYPYYRPSS